MQALLYKSIDTMKKNKDTITGQLSDAEILDLCTRLVEAGVTHIAVAMPSDFDADYRANGTVPSPRTAEAHIVKWFQTIHQVGANVLFRGAYCAMENIWNFPYDKAATPQGSLASAPTDGTSTWLGKYYVFMHTLMNIWQSGDIMAPAPEETNFVFGGNSFLSSAGAGLQANYSQFFRDLQDLENNCFNSLPASSNLVPNPNFNQDTTNWTLDGDYSLSSSDSIYGGKVVLQNSVSGFNNFTTINDGTGIPIVASTTYTASFWAKVTLNSGFAPIVEINAQSAYTNNLAAFNLADTGGVWKRFWVNFTTPVWASRIYFRIYNNNGNVTASYAAFQVEQDTLTQYMDGTQAYCSWQGTPYASVTNRSVTAQGLGVKVGLTTNNYSEVRSGWLDNAIFTKAGMATYDYYGNYNNDGYDPVQCYVNDLNAVYAAKGVPVFQQEWGDIYTQNWSNQARVAYVKYLYDQLTPLASSGKLIGFNYWGGWEGQNTSILYKDGSGHYQLNGRGKVLAAYFKGKGTTGIPAVDVNGNF